METDVDYDLNKICRSCLSNSGDLISVFESHEQEPADVTALCEIIMTFTQVQVMCLYALFTADLRFLH